MIQEASCKHGKYKGLNHFFEIRETIFLIILRRLTQNQEKILVGEGGGSGNITIMNIKTTNHPG